MTKQEFDKKYVGINKAVHCPTEELAKEFLEEADKHGYKWATGRSYLEVNNWAWDVEFTCYDLFTGTCSNIDQREKFDYEIIEFKGFEKPSYIEQIAKMLGVEIEEEFQLEKYKKVRFKFSDKALLSKRECNDLFFDSGLSLNVLLQSKIIKLPQKWKPKEGEKYWTIYLEENEAISHTWWDDDIDETFLKHNAVFKTKEEAEKAYQAVLKTLENL